MKFKHLFLVMFVYISVFSLQSCKSKSGYKQISVKQDIAGNVYTDAGSQQQNDQSSTVSDVNNNVSATRQNAITRAVALTSPAVVGINVTEVMKVQYRDPFFDDPFFQQFFGYRGEPRYKQYEIKGLGSGFIISPDGYILTNYHVAGNASKIVVTMTNGKKYDAQIIGADEVSDVALLKIDGESLPYLKLANSDDEITGEWVIAFGNPFGLFKINAKPTVTVGVISNKGLNMIQGKKVYKGLIQTDAAISSGNSGGPLVNALGEVVGMNTMIISTAQNQQGEAGSIGIGFAIPINRIKRIISLLKEDKKINRNFSTGIEVREIDDEIAHFLKTDIKEGVVIFSIMRRSLADNSGFEPGDIILEIDGNKILRKDDYYVIVNDGIVGQKFDFLLLRNGKKIHKTLILKQMQ